MANNSRENVEIPGYYWDNVTKRYYREDPTHPRPLPEVLTGVTDPNNYFKPTNFPSNVLAVLKKRDLGFGKWSKNTFEDFVIVKNLKHLKCIKEIKSIGTNEVTFLKGGENCMYLELSNTSGSIYCLTQNMHFFSPRKSPIFSSFRPSLFSTVDLCEGLKSENSHSMFVVSSDSTTWKMALWQSATTPDNRMIEFLRPYTSRTPYWCCSKNDFTKRFIFGKLDTIVICTFRANTGYCTQPIQGQVRSVQFDKQGNLIYAGVHTGHFEMLDSRTKESVFRTRLHSIGIDEIVPVFDDQQLICGAFDGMLCNFDLRMRKPINEYLGHVHSPRKVPFSINEPNNLLCATGLDNVTRLWSIGKGGDPIKYIHPPEVGHPCRSWLVSDGSNCLVYQYQRSNTYIYGNDNIELLPDSEF